MIAEILTAGEKNAISTPELCRLTGIDNARVLRAAIAKERKAGAVILSSCAGGYFLPGSREETERFIRSQDKKARSIMVVLQSARKYLQTVDGQLALDERGQCL